MLDFIVCCRQRKKCSFHIDLYKTHSVCCIILQVKGHADIGKYLLLHFNWEHFLLILIWLQCFHWTAPHGFEFFFFFFSWSFNFLKPGNHRFIWSVFYEWNITDWVKLILTRLWRLKKENTLWLLKGSNKSVIAFSYWKCKIWTYYYYYYFLFQ